MTSTAALAAVFYFAVSDLIQRQFQDSLVEDCHDNTFDEYL